METLSISYQRLFEALDPMSIRSLLALAPPSESHHPNLTPPLCEQPKPQHSYIGLIAMAILSSPERKMILSEVYDWIVLHYPYFRTRGSGWRNSIRHNLSLNDCFIKAGRAANGKGHYWAIHPANLRDFERGDFRRRRAQRKVRRHMGLSVPEGESSDESPSASPRLFPLVASNPLSYASPIFGFTVPYPVQFDLQKGTNEESPLQRPPVLPKSFTIDAILNS
ncbi:unnamed protein product, partial [Mesorhabditis spiculigera]